MMDIVKVLRDPELIPHKRALLSAAISNAADEIERLRAVVGSIERVAACGTAEAFLGISDDGKRLHFAMSVRDAGRLKKAQEEIERLRAELANKDQILGDTLAVLCGDGGHYRAEHGDIKAKEHGLKRYHDLLVSEDGLRAELAEYRQDAERYRWLRYPRMGWDIVRKTDGELLCAEYLDGIELDAAIDASRKGEGGVGGRN